VAAGERLFPAEWRAQGNDIAPDFHTYIAPLVGPIAPYARFTGVSSG
jgi:hypothetical protein